MYKEHAMFLITRVGANRLDIEMNGKLDAEQMARALDELVSKSEGIVHGLMLYDIVDYRLPSFDAILLEFSRLPSMIGFIKRFDKAAVLTDKRWLKAASEIEGAVIPGLEIKAFKRDQKAEAESWLSS